MGALRSILAISVAAELAGCALNSPPERGELSQQALPNFKVPPEWTAQSGAASAVGDRWLAAFNVPQLDALVREALVYNPDLQVAAARVYPFLMIFYPLPSTVALFLCNACGIKGLRATG